jgi:hypothetical protein
MESVYSEEEGDCEKEDEAGSDLPPTKNDEIQ